MIERPPRITNQQLAKALLDKNKESNKELQALLDKINDGYEYWDTVKYKKLTSGITDIDLWTYVKASRLNLTIGVWQNPLLMLGLTNRMQRLCHEFDMNFGGSWGDSSVIPAESRQQYLVSSLMEEAIYSSQMEGAATTRKVAKDMLRKKMSPRDKSQQMIVNNYQTINYIAEHKTDSLTPELLLHVHQLMTSNTLDSPDDSGRFRKNDDIVVENGITHETGHIPPTYTEIPSFVKSLCDFFNETHSKVFIHPIIRGIIIHFMIAYVHPFADGNGRTARAMFYWYMLRQGYWLTEYMSISRVIAKSKKAYEKSFLYAEADMLDIGYFVNYNLGVLEKSFKQLQEYIKRKQLDKNSANKFFKLGNINERQAQILKMYYEDPALILTVKDLQVKFLVTPTTAKNDLMLLLERKFIKEIAFNKVKKGYIKGELFDSQVIDIVNKQ
ncbi:MAG: Fic family protein [Bacteroidaceae bacterium]|nr:Fic family protein [Bacteroidaceae bacterium]